MSAYISELPVWQILCIAGILLVILEMATPAMFFLNLALACFFTALVSVYTTDFTILSIVWVVSSLLLIFLFRPLMVRKNRIEASTTGMGRYVGAKAKVLEEVSPQDGVVSVFDERWNAVSSDGSRIAKGEQVIIEKHENLTLYVRKDI